MVQTNEDDFKIPTDNPKEQMEETVKAMAGMCGLFYTELISSGVPEDAAIAMSVEYTHVITCGAMNRSPEQP